MNDAIGFNVNEKLIRRNRSHKSLNPEGVVVHSTATPGATDTAEQKYFDKADRKASAHYFVDWDSITRCVPENEVAWHAGKTANSKFLSVEMCEPYGHNERKFQEVWSRTAWLVADICVRYGWEIDRVWSHDRVSKTWRESNHSDPTGYLAAYGRAFDHLKDDIDRNIALARNRHAQEQATRNRTAQEISSALEQTAQEKTTRDQAVREQVNQNQVTQNQPEDNRKGIPSELEQNSKRYRVTIAVDGEFDIFEKAVHGYLIDRFNIDYVLYGDSGSKFLSATCTEESMKQIKEAAEHYRGRVSVNRI